MSIRTRHINVTSNKQLTRNGDVIDGFIVNSTSSGVFRLYAGTVASGETICNTITPSAGVPYTLFGISNTNGIFFDKTYNGTIDITFFIRTQE